MKKLFEQERLKEERNLQEKLKQKQLPQQKSRKDKNTNKQAKQKGNNQKVPQSSESVSESVRVGLGLTSGNDDDSTDSGAIEAHLAQASLSQPLPPILTTLLSWELFR